MSNREKLLKECIDEVQSDHDKRHAIAFAEFACIRYEYEQLSNCWIKLVGDEFKYFSTSHVYEEYTSYIKSKNQTT